MRVNAVKVLDRTGSNPSCTNEGVTVSYPPPPPPDQPPGESMDAEQARLWAIAAHIGSLVAAWIAMGFLAPLVVLLAVGNRSAFARRHAVESLNFQISLLIYLLVAVVLAFFTLGLGLIIIVPIGILFGLGALVAIILATLAAADGRDFHYPLCIRLID